MTRLLFETQDTLFFRDGRPFNQGESGGGIDSLFPPSPMTLVGAARAAWAKSLGWSGKGKWMETIGLDLGGDQDELHGIECAGPILFVENEPVFPAPALLMGRIPEYGPPDDVVRLRPSDSGVYCDLGLNIRLPVPETDAGPTEPRGHKLLDNWWLTKAGLERVLLGYIPEKHDFISPRMLWNQEFRVGIALNPETGMTEQSMLYSIRHVRLADHVRLAMRIEGNLDDFPATAQTPLGGEARSCWLQKQVGDLNLPDTALSTESDCLRYAVFVLTPLNPSLPLQPGGSFENLPGTIISACLPHAQRWGGWDTVNRQPRAMEPHLAPGSVIFIEANPADKQFIENLHGKTVGRRKSWGFGLIAVGRWN